MLKVHGFLAAAAVLFGMSLPAQAEVWVDAQALQNAAMVEASLTQGLDWKVGDKTNYKISNTLINGKSNAFVREDTGASFWVEQNMDLGFMGKQKIEILYDKATGQVQKLLANGQEQALPNAADYEVLEMKEDHIRVAAGEFDCIFVKVKDKKNNQVQDAWINPKAVPISGTLKSVADSQFGKITQELTSFEFARR